MSTRVDKVTGFVRVLDTIRLNAKGQITVPQKYCDALELEAGAPLTVLQIGEGLMLIPEQKLLIQLCNRIAQIFTRYNIGADEVLAGLPEARERVFARLYPDLKTEESSQKRRRKRK